MPNHAADLERRVYDEVLKIAVERFPPDYFTLLGISPAIEDAAAVDFAAKHQSDRLRRGTPKELVSAARYILKRVDRARICLSDASSRKAYLESIGKGQISNSGRPHPNPAVSSRTSKGIVPSRPITSNPTPPVAVPARSECSIAPTNNQTSTEIDFDSLLSDFGAEEVASNLIGLTDVPYKSKKASNGQAVVFGSIAALSVAVLSVIGLIAFLTGTDPPATQSPGPTEIAAEVATSTVAGAHPVSNEKPVETAQHVAASALASGGSETKPGAVATDFKDGVRADSRAASMKSRISVLPSGDEASDTSSSLADEVPPMEPDSQEANPPQADQPAVPSVARKELVTEIELPPLRADQTAATADNMDSVTELGYLDEKAANSLRISVDEPYKKQHAYAVFYVRRPDEAVAVWEIRLKAEAETAPTVDAEAKDKRAAEESQLNSATEGFDEVIASLQLDDSGLKFRWGQTKRATLVEQLRNCALVLTADGLSHQIQLRPQLMTYKFMFDLSKSNHIFRVAEEYLPNADVIKFAISDIQLPGLTYELEPENGVIENGDTLRIKTLDGNIPVEFQFVLSVTASRATVKFVPRHQLGRRWYPFTGSQVHGAINDLEQALADGRGRFGAAQSALSSLPGQLSSVEARLRADSPDYAQIQSQRTLLIRQLNSARGAARRLSKSIPEMEAKLPQLNSLVALGKKIHMQGRLNFRAYIPLTEGELILLRTGTEEPPVKEEKAKE